MAQCCARRRTPPAFTIAVTLAAVSLLVAPAIATAVDPGAAERPDTVALSHIPLPGDSSGIGPGSRLHVDRPDGTLLCTAAFLFTDGARVLLATAGSCLLPAGSTATHGPGADYDPSGTLVRVCVTGCATGGLTSGLTGTHVALGPVVYARQTGPDGQLGNDFGLVVVPEQYTSFLRSGLPTWGGPTTTDSPTSIGLGGTLCYHGNGIATGETILTKSRLGIAFGSNPNNWSMIGIATDGDVGSAVVSCRAEGAGWHGWQPIGIMTNSFPVDLAAKTIIQGTTTTKAIQMATQAGLSVSVIVDGA